MHSQRGSMLLDTVIFLALLSILSMTLIGQLVFMRKISAQEDARIQGLMAARIQMENMRTRWTYTVPDDSPLEDTFTPPIDFDRLGEGGYSISKMEDYLYQVEIWVNNLEGSEVYRTLSQVWVIP